MSAFVAASGVRGVQLGDCSSYRPPAHLECGHIPLSDELSATTDNLVELLADDKPMTPFKRHGFICDFEQMQPVKKLLFSIFKQAEHVVQYTCTLESPLQKKISLEEWVDVGRKLKQRTQFYSQPYTISLEYLNDKDGGIDRVVLDKSPYAQRRVLLGSMLWIVARRGASIVRFRIPPTSVDYSFMVASEIYRALLSMDKNDGNPGRMMKGISGRRINNLYLRNPFGIIECNFTSKFVWTDVQVYNIAEAVSEALYPKERNNQPMTITYHPHLLGTAKHNPKYFNSMKKFPSGISVDVKFDFNGQLIYLLFDNVQKH